MMTTRSSYRYGGWWLVVGGWWLVLAVVALVLDTCYSNTTAVCILLSHLFLRRRDVYMDRVICVAVAPRTQTLLCPAQSILFVVGQQRHIPWGNDDHSTSLLLVLASGVTKTRRVMWA